LLQGEVSVIPVEVKAEENLKAKSLKTYHQKFSPSYAIRTSLSDFRQDGWLKNIPLYAFFAWLKKEVWEEVSPNAVVWYSKIMLEGNSAIMSPVIILIILTTSSQLYQNRNFLLLIICHYVLIFAEYNSSKPPFSNVWLPFYPGCRIVAGFCHSEPGMCWIAPYPGRWIGIEWSIRGIGKLPLPLSEACKTLTSYKRSFTWKRYQILVILKENHSAMSRNTSISIETHFDEFIKNRISSGRYKNASEVIRAGLRLLEEEENKLIVLREAIQEGLESGVAHDFNPDLHLERLKSKKNLNG
jgi:antitoxin ParD1/3/4